MSIVVDVERKDAVGADWRSRGACRWVDPELFFPVGSSGPAVEEQTREAQRVCRGCPVWRECRSWAVDSGQEHGIWGGLSERELQAVVRKRAAARRAARRAARTGAAA